MEEEVEEEVEVGTGGVVEAIEGGDGEMFASSKEALCSPWTSCTQREGGGGRGEEEEEEEGEEREERNLLGHLCRSSRRLLPLDEDKEGGGGGGGGGEGILTRMRERETPYITPIRKWEKRRKRRRRRRRRRNLSSGFEDFIGGNAVSEISRVFPFPFHFLSVSCLLDVEKP